jgi:DNA-binding response OmpR family regulator
VAKILIIGAGQRLISVLDTGLKQEGFEVAVAHNGVAALRVVQREKPDGVILNPAMAWLGGVQVGRRHEMTDGGEPMILLNLKTNESKKIFPKVRCNRDEPAAFDANELIAGMKALLKRGVIAGPAGVLRAGLIEMDLEGWTVSVKGRKVILTAIEFGLLRMLLNANGRVLTRDILRDIVWEDRHEHNYGSRAIDVHIGRLRRKLGEMASCVQTVRGVGYRFAVARERV